MDNYSAEAEQIGRRRRMAEMLMQSGAEMPQGQMVSGHYVAPNPTQYLAQALRSYMGGKGIYNAEQQENAMRQRQAQAARDWMNQMPRGTENTSMAGPTIPQQPSAEDYMNWGIRGMQVDPRAAQMGMQSANLALNREDRQQGRAQQEQLRRDQLAQQAQQAEQNRALQREIANIKLQGGEKPYFQPVQTAQGIYAFNARTGKMELVPGGGGSPVIGSQSDPALQGRIAGAKAAGTTEGKDAAESRIELPKVIAQGDEAVRLVDDLLSHPGMKQAVGASRMMQFQKIPGTPAYDFETRLKQLQGKQFLEAFQTLKGGGQITEVEGTKATQAIARMDAAQSEKEFESAAREFQNIVRAGVDRARQKAGGSATSTNIDALLEKYK